MLADTEKLLICVTPGGVVVGVDATDYSLAQDGLYVMNAPVNLLVKAERNGSSIVLNGFLFPCTRIQIAYPALAIRDDAMVKSFRDQLRANYQALTVRESSGLLLTPR